MGAEIGPRLDKGLYEIPDADLVQRVTGIEPERASGHAFLKEAGFRSIQRLVIADASGGKVVGVWPAELKPHAQFFYSEHRAETFVSSGEGGGWLVRPNPHIGFWQAPAAQRLYLEPRFDDPVWYVELWEGPGSSRIGAHSSEELRVSVWPWLQKQELATAEDDPVLGEFLIRLSKLKRPAHLRAGLSARRKWSTDEVASVSAEELESNIRDAVNTLLGSIGEPSFPIA